MPEPKTRDGWMNQRLKLARRGTSPLEDQVDFLIEAGVLPVKQPMNVMDEAYTVLAENGWPTLTCLEVLAENGFRIVKD